MIGPAHLYVSRRLPVAVTECDGPLRQFHHAKDGLSATSTCNAPEWCMTHAESHGTHDHPPLDQSTSERSLKRTLSGKMQQFNCKLFFRCANPIMIPQEVAQIISRRFAREWCVVVLRTTWSTSSLINTNSPKSYCINLLHNISWSTLPRRENCTSQLNIWERPPPR